MKSSQVTVDRALNPDESVLKRGGEDTGHKETRNAGIVLHRVHDKVRHQLVTFLDQVQLERVTVTVHGVKCDTTKTRARDQKYHPDHVDVQRSVN